MPIDTATFTVSVTGESTGEKFHGSFKTRLRLSHRDYLRQDAIRRELLGPNPDGASPRAQNSAEVFSTIAVHLVDPIPSWWRDNEGGLGLEDDNVIAAVFEGVVKAKADHLAETKKQSDQAKAELAKMEPPR